MKQAVVSFSKLVICTSPINNTLFAAQHFAKFFFSCFFLLGISDVKKLNTMFMKVLGGKQGVLWEMCKWQMTCSLVKIWENSLDRFGAFFSHFIESCVKLKRFGSLWTTHTAFSFPTFFPYRMIDMSSLFPMWRRKVGKREDPAGDEVKNHKNKVMQI